MVEQVAVNDKVLGSSPSRGAQVDYRCNLRLYQRVLERLIGLTYHPVLGSEV